MNPRELPIWGLADTFVSTLQRQGRLVLVAGVGSGKSTQAPQMALDANLAAGRRVVVLQPRRVAARSVATRVAWERGGRLGDEVGYQVRFDDRLTADTRLAYVTEGIFLRWVQNDPELRDVGAVFLDEFHERNLLSDLALALVKRLRSGPRPDLKLVVMSATMEAEPVAAYLDGAPVLNIDGRPFPVVTRWGELGDRRPAPERAAEVVERIVQSGEGGDVLVFMPGMSEILATLNQLRAVSLGERCLMLPLHGDLSPADQDRVFEPASCRKIIVSTNVAETSVTIDGVRHVVDSGLARVARYDAERGLGVLAMEEISRASADQRAGRAGRTSPGVCWRLWSESGHLNRPAKPTPEIRRADLAEMVLQLHGWGLTDAATVDWLDRPEPAAVAAAETLLKRLGAVAAAGGLTPAGRAMLALPMHPRYSRMLVEAARLGVAPQASLCAALTSGRDLLARPARDDPAARDARELFEGSERSDFHTLMRAYQFARQADFDPARCRQRGVRAEVARSVAATHAQFLELAERQGLTQRAAPAGAEDDALGKCLLAGFPDQVAARRDGGSLDCFIADQREGVLARESVVKAPLFVAAGLREVELRGRMTTLLSMATAIEPAWLREIWPEHLAATIETVYDRLHKRVASIRRTRFLGVLCGEEHQRDVIPEAGGRELARAFAAGALELPNLGHEVRQWIVRANLVALALPELELPRLDGAALEGLFAGAFRGMTLAKEAQAADLLEAVRRHAGPGAREWIESAAPKSIAWPGGKSVRLQYPEDPDARALEEMAPAAQVKLQECWALEVHPAVAEGRSPVLLRLQGPDGKRIDETRDFPRWRTTVYPRLRQGLRARHPGHLWP